MKVIGTALPSTTDAISYYRGLGPLMSMARDQNIMVHNLTQFNWASLRQLSCLFMQRPYTKNHVDIFTECKYNNVPVWLDYDDLLTNMPTANPNWITYEKNDIKKNLEYLITNADVITVSTPYLGQQLLKWNKNVVVLPNGIDIDAFPYRTADCGERAKAFYWRGSHTHHKDVWTYADEIVAAAEEFKDWKFHFMADNLWFLTDRMRHEQTYIVDALPIERYFAHLWRVAASCCIVPLHDHPFNRSKSNIAYLEAVFSGAMAIVPDWEEWRHPGALLYNDNKSFLEAFKVIATGQVDVRKMSNDAWVYICDNFALNKINVKRRQVFERLIM